MPDARTSILLRLGPHDDEPSNSTTRVRYALQCDNFSIQIAKTPIQVPAAGQSPILIDIGFHRPSISINGTIPTLGDGVSEPDDLAQELYVGMPHFDFERPDVAGASQTCRYYFPYKNALEDAAIRWIYIDSNELEMEIGDSITPTGGATGDPIVSTHTTGGGVYKIAIQQCRFQIDASKEDRWTFAMQCVAKSRVGVF